MSEPKKRIAAQKMSNVSLCDLTQGLPSGNFLPLCHGEQLPVLIEMKCDGLIPNHEKFSGVKYTDFGIIVSINMENENDLADMNRLHEELKQLAMKMEISWREIAQFTDKQVAWAPRVNGMTYASVPKPGKKPFPPVFGVESCPGDIEAGILKIVNMDDEPMMSLDKILGTRVRTARVELQGLIIKRNKKDPSLIDISWRKRLRYLQVDTNSSFFEHVFPEEKLTHDQNCVRKHITYQPVRTFVFGQTAILHEMIFPEKPAEKEKKETINPANKRAKINPSQPVQEEKEAKEVYKPTIARITLMDGECPCYVEFNGGGHFPMKFAISFSEKHGTTHMRFVLADNAEIAALEAMSRYLKSEVGKNRFKWFPASSGKALNIVEEYAKEIIPPIKRKFPKDISDEAKAVIMATPLKEGDETWPRDMSAQIDDHTRVVESDGTLWNRGLECIAGRRWDKIVINLRNVYLQTGQSPKADWSIRLVYVKMQSAGGDYIVDAATD